jgi:hypothetical protein
MTVHVPKTVADKIAPDFAAAVEAHRQALLAHRFSKPAQQAKPTVKAVSAVAPILPTPAKGRFPAKSGRRGHPGRAAILGTSEIIGEPAPAAHPIIESCIKRVRNAVGPDDFIVDYVIYDDA